MKENFELVEKLVEKTGVSYGEAKAALEKSDWDILDAIIDLEAQGKIPGESKYSTRSSAGQEESERKEKERREKQRQESERKKNEYKENTVGFFTWLRGVFDKGNANYLEMYKDGKRIIGMPVTVFVLLLVFGFWILIPLMIVGLFFGCRYRFSGPDLGKEKVNEAMGKATDYAENIKQEIKTSIDNSKTGGEA